MQTNIELTNKSGVLMRFSRFVMLFLGTVALSACGKDEVTTPTLPPLSQVRFINAVSDTGAVDIRAIDQVELSPVANALAFRAATVYYPTEAGVRRFRVFPTSTVAAVTSQILSEASVTLPANRRITLLLAGSARSKTVNLWVIDDDAPAPAAGSVSARLVNAAGGVIDGYAVATATTALPATPTYSSLGLLTASPRVQRATGPAAIRVTDAGTTTVQASTAGPASPTAVAGANPGAGVSSAGTAFSAYYFRAGAAGSANASLSAPGIVWFVDRNPCDAPAAAGCL